MSEDIDAMLTEAIAYKRRNNQNATVLYEAVAEIRSLRQQLAAANAEIERLRKIEAALRKVEYVPMILGHKDSRYPTCPCCHARIYGSRSIEPHKPDCIVGKALASDGGKGET